MKNMLRCLVMAVISTLFLFGFSNSNAQVVVSQPIPSNANPNPGDQITVAINFDMTGMVSTADSLLGSFTGTIDWDPTVLSFVSHSGILQGYVGIVNTAQAGNGHIVFNGANPLGVSGMFDVLVITFDVTGAGGTSTALDLEYSAMAAAFTFTNLLPFLTVNDGMVTVAGGTVNNPPQLTAISNQTMDENTTLDVPVTATDPDTDNLTLSVNNLPAFGSFTDNGDGTGTISFAPGFDDAGTYSMMEVIAIDDGTPPMADTVYFDLTVNNVNRAPTLTPIADQTMDENTTLDVPVASADPDMDNLTLSVNNLPAFGSFTDNGDGTGTISFAPGFDDAGTYSMIEVIATDDGTPPMADTVYFDLTVNNVNRAPTLTPIADQTMDENTTLDVPVASTDPDMDNLTLSVNNLPAFGSFTDNGDGTGTISFAPLTGDAGTYPNIEVISADDGTPSLSDTVSFTLTVTQVVVNNPPQLTAISDQTMDENTTLDVPVVSTDPDMDNLTLSVNNLPTFGSFIDNGDGTGTISFAPGFDDAGTYSMIEVIATDDGTPPMADTVYFDLTVNNVNRTPTLTPIADQTMDENTTLDVPVASTDPDMDNLTLSVNNLPTFGSFTDNGDGTGTISFAPLTGDAGTYPNIEVISADDGTPSLSDTVSFTLTVTQAGVNNPPQLTAISNQTMDENTTLDVPVAATDIDMDNITLSVNNLPAFGSFTDNGDGTGTISFAPGFDDAGTYSMIEVIATDDGTPPMADTVYFDLTVNNVNRAPTLTPIADQTMDENTTLDVPAASTDPDMDNLTLSVNNLPAFGSFTDNGDGTGTISFAPLSGDAGVYPNIEVVVTDDGTPSLSDTVTFTLTVTQVVVNNPPQLTAISDQTMDENTTLDVPVAATDIDMDNITLSVNNLPAFGSFTDNGDGTGTISFAPGFDDAGTYSMIEVIATDDGTPPMADTVYFDLTVNNVNRAPTLTAIADQTMDENTTLDVPVASTDPDMDNLTLSVNNLPAFGSFTDNGDGTGTISFAPGFDDAGTYSMIEVIATDDGTPPMADTVYFDLTVNNVNRAPTLTPIADQTMDEGDTLNVPISAIDLEGNSITLTANNLPSFGTLMDSGNGTGTIRFTPDFNQAGVYQNIEVIATDNGTPPLSDTTYFDLTVSDVMGINDPFQTPVKYELSQNFPNPFNPTTQIRFALPKASVVEIYLFNVMGQKVATILDGYEPAGYHTINFDASQMTSGVYFFSIKAGEFEDIKKMILMK